MNGNWTGKIQATLLFIYISWKKEYLQNFEVSLENVILMRSEDMKVKCIKECVWKSSLFVNLQAGISQLYYKLTSSQTIFGDFD